MQSKAKLMPVSLCWLTNIVVRVVCSSRGAGHAGAVADIVVRLICGANANIVACYAFFRLLVILLTHSALLASVKKLIVVRVVTWAASLVPTRRLANTTLLYAVKSAPVGAFHTLLHSLVVVGVSWTELAFHCIDIYIVPILACDAGSCHSVEHCIAGAELTFSSLRIENVSVRAVNAFQFICTVILGCSLIAGSTKSQSMVVFLVVRTESTLL